MANDDIEVLLSTRIPPVGENGRDWWKVLSQLRLKLKEICAVPFVQADPVCQRVLQRMVEAGDMKEIDQLMDDLGARIGVLLAAQGGNVDDLARLGIGQQRRGRASLRVVQDRAITMDGEAPPARTRIRL